MFATVLAVMSVPGVALLIPKFLIVNYLGIYDTYTAMILPLIVDAAGVFIMKQFFDSIPVSIEEAARIDGAGVFRTFWSVVLPMAKPALITLTILSFQGSWNEFTHFLVATQDVENATPSSPGWRAWPAASSARGRSTRSSSARPCSRPSRSRSSSSSSSASFTSGANEGGVKG